MDLFLRFLAFLTGLALVAMTFFSALKTFVLPRSAPDPLTRLVFLSIRRLFSIPLKLARNYERRDQIMAFFAPLSLMALVPIWYLLVTLGYSGMYWAMGTRPWADAIMLSGSSLLTLGFIVPQGFFTTGLAFSEATLGLILVALLIAYLPTMYAAFAQREAAVTLLEVRGGDPPSAVEMLRRYNRIHGLDKLGEVWDSWERWFAEVDESHTSLPALVFFRSPTANHSWVTAAGAVLDAAALLLSVVDIPRDPKAMLCLRAGYLALRHIIDFFHIPYNPDPSYPAEPISIRREEFDEACAYLSAEGIPLRDDREQAWQDFAGWRVNYDQVLLTLAGMTMAPHAPWSADRQPAMVMPRLVRRKRHHR
jgi:hypothetical protein